MTGSSAHQTARKIYNESATEAGLAREAVVNTHDHLNIALLEKMLPEGIREVPAEAKAYQRRLFENESDGLTWLEGEGFKAD